MRLFKTLPAFAIAVMLFQGCSSSTTPTPTPTPTPSTVVAFKAQTVYTYNQDKIDTAMPGMSETRNTSDRDVITSTIIDTNGSYSNKSGKVVVMTNMHTKAGVAMDTTWYYQDAGNLYCYNYGLASLNSIPTFVALLGKPLDAGWVLQAKLGAAVSTNWQAATTSLVIHYSGASIPTTIVDNATQKADTTVIVNGKTMTAKHALHTVVASANMGAGSVTVATVLVDSYVTPEEGSVLNVAHSFTFSVPTLVPATQIAGQYTELVKVQ